MKNIFDFKHVKGVKAWVLVHKGEMAGRIVANYSDNPCGSVCTAQVMFLKGPLHKDEIPKSIPLGRAGGYGYDKFSAAVGKSLRLQGIEPKEEISGRGDSSVKGFLEKNGYLVFEAI